MELIPSVDLAFGSRHWNSQYEIQRYTGVTEGGRIRLKNQHKLIREVAESSGVALSSISYMHWPAQQNAKA